VSCVVPNPSFANQTKTKVNNPELRKLCRKATAKMLEEFEKRKRDEFNKVVELLTRESKAERAAERARKQVLEATKAIEKNQRRKVFASDKLKDAEFLGQDSTLLLVEGLSAGSSMATARDEKKYGILALRGKTVNAFSNNDEDFYNNEEVKLLLSALNIVPNKYDPKKLRYGKVAITVDSDSDGYSIGLLIMCALYKVAPQFIEEGRLCWLRSPLYIVKKGKEEKYYFTDEEFNKATKGGIVQRNKGLGSLSPSQARNSMFSKEYQRMDVLKPDEQSLPLLLELMGKDSEPKKKFIFENVDFSEIRE
jgi:DNA gyrase subunit B